MSLIQRAIFSYKVADEQITNCLMNFMITSVICVCITIIFVILSCSLAIDAVNNFEQRQRALRFLLFYWNTILNFYAGSLAFWLMNNKTLSPDAVQHSLILPAKQTKPLTTETPVGKSTTCCKSQYRNSGWLETHFRFFWNYFLWFATEFMVTSQNLAFDAQITPKNSIALPQPEAET